MSILGGFQFLVVCFVFAVRNNAAINIHVRISWHVYSYSKFPAVKLGVSKRIHIEYTERH